MNKLSDFFDAYGLKAKFIPALLFVVFLNAIYLLYFRRVFMLPIESFEIGVEVVGSIGLIFLLSSTIRGCGKYVIEEAMYKGRVNMPTTQILLTPEKSKLSQSKIKEIYGYIYDDLEIDIEERKALLDGQISEMKKEISEVVSKVRDKTREDSFLFRSNIQYGMFRNTSGALLLVVLIMLGILIFDMVYFDSGNADIVLALLFISIVLFTASVLLTRKNAKDYAERLFDAYILVLNNNNNSQ